MQSELKIFLLNFLIEFFHLLDLLLEGAYLLCLFIHRHLLVALYHQEFMIGLWSQVFLTCCLCKFENGGLIIFLSYVFRFSHHLHLHFIEGDPLTRGWLIFPLLLSFTVTEQVQELFLRSLRGALVCLDILIIHWYIIISFQEFRIHALNMKGQKGLETVLLVLEPKLVVNCIRIDVVFLHFFLGLPDVLNFDDEGDFIDLDPLVPILIDHLHEQCPQLHH